jgi:hypothetical protein
MSKSEPPDKIEWEEPPPRESRGGSKWDPIARVLRSRPGQWACIGRDIATSVVTDIRRGTLKCWQPEGSFEVATRNHTERWRADVYVRYVGENREHAE